MTYGVNTMLPIEVGEFSLQRHYFTKSKNNEALQIDLDLIEQVREEAVIITESYNQCPSVVSRRGPSMESMWRNLEGPVR